LGELGVVGDEAIHTFEGTETIQTLLVDRDITGLSVFVWASRRR
jgi:hypothetical protein